MLWERSHYQPQIEEVEGNTAISPQSYTLQSIEAQKLYQYVIRLPSLYLSFSKPHHLSYEELNLAILLFLPDLLHLLWILIQDVLRHSEVLVS